MSPWFNPLNGFLNLFLESPCPLCQRSTASPFCRTCQQQLQSCRLPNPQMSWGGNPALFAWGSYGGTLKRAIALLKYENQPQLAKPLGIWLAQAWLAEPNLSQLHPIVVPIPIHRQKRQQRGYNQAELLANSFCTATGLSLQSQGLSRVRETTAQFGLSAAARLQNLSGSLQVNRQCFRDRSQSVLLLDDIYTTGATIQAAIQAFQKQRIFVLGVVVLAQTPKLLNSAKIQQI